MSQFLVNVHGEFGSGHVEPRWARHFALAHDCSLSLGRVAMAGFNARDYFTVLDTIGRNTSVIVDRTKAVFGNALGPALDALSGNGFANAGFIGFNTIIFGNGLALQNPSLRAATEADIDTLWNSFDIAVQGL
ncbi:hypothetical protein OG921_14350 [Aldersonia sp. NBC_00410]|uniref:hypothetical protein n=1 Tax=Aldersonia sp. NBC_00410 TaxID=2975954 RepID=UPI002255A7F2|nr:hypothetical protein [Aldersonia sp. NBC_00410]MCX5044347.1 hypothetical protein [Aldersonia sp. NBC_00410]